MKRLTYLLSVGLFMLTLVPTALAADFRGGDEVVVAADEVIEDDLYAGGATVTINGTVQGDVIASGRTVTVNGTVTGDLMAAAQSVLINGEVGDDARIAGAALTLGENARIKDDVIAAGYSLETEAGSAVGGSLSFGGGQVLLAGSVTENLNVGAGGLELSGSVGGNVTAELGADTAPFDSRTFIPNLPAVPDVAPGLTLGNNARVEGDFDLTSPERPTIVPEAVGGEVTVDQQDVSVVSRTRSRAWTGLQRFIALAAVGLLLLWLAPAFLRRSVEQLETRPLTSLGLGTLTLVGVPVALTFLLGLFILLVVLLALLTLGNLGGAVGVVGGAIVLILGVLFGLTLVYLTYVIVAYYGGRFILTRSDPNANVSPVWALLLGALLLVIVTSVPVIGSIAALSTMLFGLGALWRLRRESPNPREGVKRVPA